MSIDGGVEPIWAANGDVFYRNSAGNRLFAVPTATRPSITVGQPVSLIDQPFYVAPTGSPRPQYDVSADGRRVLLVAYASSPESARPRMVFVQNWVEEIRRAIAGN